MTLYIDTETYSETPIRNGTYAYARTAEVMIVTFAVDDGPAQAWEPDLGPMPSELQNALRSECEVVAHNAGFDRNVLRLGNLHIDIPVHRWRCTMAQAMAHSLPGGLGPLCKVLGVDTEDHKMDGKDLIQMFCKPRPKKQKVRRYTRETHPAEWAEFVKYATQDIPALRAVHRKLPDWNYRGSELALWHLDQRINDRGVAVDVEFSRAATDTIARVQKRLADQTVELTDGAVASTTKRDQLLKHILAAYGVSLPDMTSATLERRLEDPDLPEPVKELLLNRLEASLTSGKKHAALLKAVDPDGRLRGLLRFCGAARTGRWSGVLFQPQNLVRPPQYLGGEEYDRAVELIKSDVAELVYPKPLEVISGTVRGALVAPTGRKFCIADLSNIEGRMLAWLAGEEWKTKAYAAGDDLYVKTYARSFGVPEAVVLQDKKDGGIMRQIGKVAELALGYQGAVNAFAGMAKVYGIVLPEDEVLRVVKAWRKANPAIVSFWYELEDAAKQAVANPGTRVECRRLVLRRDGAWLKIRLPSGRLLCYPHIRLDSGKLAYDGINQYTRRWGKITTYGGKLVENVTQAASRDVLAHNMPLIQASGYDIVLSVHDELITETPDTADFSGDELARLMAVNPPWADGLPLAAAGEEVYRYRK